MINNLQVGLRMHFVMGNNACIWSH